VRRVEVEDLQDLHGHPTRRQRGVADLSLFASLDTLIVPERASPVTSL
jgi:hypothetical protein